jgi:hypothetical protein
MSTQGFVSKDIPKITKNLQSAPQNVYFKPIFLVGKVSEQNFKLRLKAQI